MISIRLVIAVCYTVFPACIHVQAKQNGLGEVSS